MIVTVMQIRRMRMRVPQRLVHVLMDVGLGSLVTVMGVPVMLVVNMTVGVLQVHVLMLVRVSFRQHEPRCDRHQQRGNDQAGRDRLAQQRHCERRSNERSGTEMRRGPCRAQVPQRIDEKHEA